VIQAPLINFSQVVVVMTVAGTALFGAGAAALPSTLVALPVALALMLGPTANAALFAAMLRAAPEGMRGRVNNTVILAASALAALSPLTAGLLVEHLSGRWALLAFAAVMAAAAALAIAQPGFRNAEAAERLQQAQAPSADATPG
jgi:MFS family permease